MRAELSLEEWVKTVPDRLRCDTLWSSAYYRLAMYLYDLVWLDCDMLRQDVRGREVLRQLVRSAGGISANMEEAFGRGVGTADYVRILRIALGEARETLGWYYRSRHILPKELLDRRVHVLDQIIALLVRTINSHRLVLQTPKS